MHNQRNTVIHAAIEPYTMVPFSTAAAMTMVLRGDPKAIAITADVKLHDSRRSRQNIRTQTKQAAFAGYTHRSIS